MIGIESVPYYTYIFYIFRAFESTFSPISELIVANSIEEKLASPLGLIVYIYSLMDMLL